MPREVIDVHTHCFTSPKHTDRVREGLAAAMAEGLIRMVVVGLVNTKLDAEQMWGLIPRYVDNRGDPLFHEVDNLLTLAREHRPTLLPFVDTRHLWGGDVKTRLSDYMERGFRGLKGIYLADDANDMKLQSVPEALGISLKAYHEREWEIFGYAETHHLPLVYHMDVQHYADVASALLKDFPNVRVDFPHFGISRKGLGKLLDRYPNVFTDLASMLPYIRKSPKGYREFILHYPEQVCFGSDAFLYEAETIVEYIRVVEELELPREVERLVLSQNPRRFLGKAFGD
ncbi:amidohydrolase family protein [Desulforhabdus sp. TSK]|uniref:amidohydrolase family protein n=1 Tax=Desulforhabdus sp. TSK TaxID=2925014 RepID=UPI001FC850C1|nr:amidohydrolase family protein [Desulforhabdus sp. TSK]GKT09009.1 hypothetical protein DSTSK_23140 [Desulforhabdus sp. TSK]